MPPRRTTEHLLAEVQALTDTPDAGVLRRALSSGIGHVVAAAASRIQRHEWPDWEDDLVRAYHLLDATGRQGDPGCTGRNAVLLALDHVGHRAWDVYAKAAKTFQLEPRWGGSDDTAGGLRANGLLAMAHIRHPDVLTALADRLGDTLTIVRVGVGQAAGDLGDPAAVPLLRFKLHLGDPEPEVTSAILSALLVLDADTTLPLAMELLRSPDELTRESVGLSLAETRRAEVVEPLQDWWSSALTQSEKHTALVALAITRDRAAHAFLTGLVAHGSERDARGALRALAPFEHDEELLVSLREAASAAGREALAEEILTDTHG